MSVPTGQLYPFQEAGVRRLVQSPRLLLADDMGLGKTLQAIVAMDGLMGSGAVRRALIVCPASLLPNWRYELKRWAPRFPGVIYRGEDRFGLLESGIPVLIASFETIAADWRRASGGGTRFFETAFDLLILDEAQRLRNPETLSARVLAHALVPRRWALTGTPLENRPEDLGSILGVLEPNEFAPATSAKDYERILLLRDEIMLRRRKADVLPELPERVISYVPVELAPGQRSMYEEELLQLKQWLRGAPDPRQNSESRGLLLGALQRLRKLCVIGADEDDSGKLDLVQDEVTALAEAGEKVVIFSTFANEVLPRAARRLQAYHPLLYRGSMPMEQREKVHAQFLNDPAALVMLASLRAAGLGLTWTVARYVYHLDLWWNPQALHQADDRVHRIGQTRGVLVKRLFASQSIEEQILDLLQKKQAMFDMAIESQEPRPAPSGPSFADIYEALGLA